LTPWPDQRPSHRRHQGRRSPPRRSITLADRAGDDGYRLEAQRALGVVSFYIGDLVAARDSFEGALALYDAEVHRAHALRYEDDPGMTCLSYPGRTLWLLGYPEQVLRPVGEAVELARSLAHIPSLAEASTWHADLSLLRRQTDFCREQAGAALALASEHGFPLWTALAGASWGWAETHASEGEAGITALRRALDSLQGIGDRLFRPYC
jgi:predicted ATPase